MNYHNIKTYPGKSVDECKVLCSANDKCLAFEYGVAYGGPGVYKPKDCQLQSSSNSDDCDGGYHNLDLYVKHGKYSFLRCTYIVPRLWKFINVWSFKIYLLFELKFQAM